MAFVCDVSPWLGLIALSNLPSLLFCFGQCLLLLSCWHTLYRFLFPTIRHHFQVNLLQYCLHATVACSQHRILPLLPIEGASMWMGVLRHLGLSVAALSNNMDSTTFHTRIVSSGSTSNTYPNLATQFTG